jgi:hypothetical protein
MLGSANSALEMRAGSAKSAPGLQLRIGSAIPALGVQLRIARAEPDYIRLLIYSDTIDFDKKRKMNGCSNERANHCYHENASVVKRPKTGHRAAVQMEEAGSLGHTNQ